MENTLFTTHQILKYTEALLLIDRVPSKVLWAQTVSIVFAYTSACDIDSQPIGARETMIDHLLDMRVTVYILLTALATREIGIKHSRFESMKQMPMRASVSR